MTESMPRYLCVFRKSNLTAEAQSTLRILCLQGDNGKLEEYPDKPLKNFQHNLELRDRHFLVNPKRRPHRVANLTQRRVRLHRLV
jgi:hypothetical protein